MAYLRRNRIDGLAIKQRNTFFKAISLIFLGASASLLLANADLIINPQISNSIAYIKQFFVTSDGTSSGTVGVALDSSGVFSKLYCNLSGSLCKTTENLFAVDAQLSGLVPRDDGQYTLFASGGKLFTGGLKSTVSGYSLATKLAIGYASPTNALDVLGSAYISGSAEILGTLTVPMLSGIASINGVNIGKFATWDTLVTNGFLTGAQVDTKINILSGNLNSLSKATLPCTQNQLPQFSGGVWVCGTIATVAETDPIWTATSANYVTNSSLSTTLGGYLTNSSLGTILSNYVTSSSLGTTLGGYVTNSSLSTTLGGYVTSSSLGTTLSDYATNSSLSTGNWNQAYTNMHGHTNGMTLALISGQALTNWNDAYDWGSHADAGYLTSYTETDPKIGTLTNTKRCTSNGSTVSCTVSPPVLSESDPKVGTLTNTKRCTSNGSTVSCTVAPPVLSESDPKVGTLTDTKRCTSNGSTVSCTVAAPVLSEGDPSFTSWMAGNPLSAYATKASLSTGNWNSAYTFTANATTSDRLVIDTANNRIGIGTGAPGYSLSVVGTGLFTNSVFAEAFLYNSDRRLKTNIVEIQDPLQKIMKIHGYTFDWKASGKHDIGVIAQEVQAVFPEAVVTKDDGFKTVNYPSLVAPLIEAVKALYTRYVDQQDQIDQLRSQVEELKTIVSQIK